MNESARTKSGYKMPPDNNDEVLLAYGMLWCTDSTDPRVLGARRELLSCLTKEQQKKAIEAACSMLALVLDIRQIKGGVFRADAFPDFEVQNSNRKLADDLERLCCAETEGKFFDYVTENITTIIEAIRHTNH